MHEDALLRAAQPVPSVVLGIRLLPLSIGHVLLLQSRGILQACASGSLTAEQAVSAALICSQSWSDSMTIDRDRFVGLKMAIWRFRVWREARRHNRRHALRYEGRSYIDAQIERLTQHLAQGTDEFPASDAPRPERTGSQRLPGCPFTLRIQQWLMTTLRLTESEAWDYPFALAKMRWACHWEAEGCLDVKNEADDSFDRFVAEKEAQAAMRN